VTIADLWYGDSAGAVCARAALAPLSWLYRCAIQLRNALYDHSLIESVRSPVPVVSVGNVSVGGTGKTPFSAYLVGELAKSGRRPAIVMRGYGDDELHLHARMNPGVPVITNRDRVAGIKVAAETGADVVVLDDAFQHRRAQRDLDVVLVSAEKWRRNLRVLPAGPLREPMTSLHRAGLIVITQKSGADSEAAAVMQAIKAISGVTAPVVVARLAPKEIVSTTSAQAVPLDSISGQRVLAIAGIGDPDSFFAQLTQLGATVSERRFRDHHAYSQADARELAEESAGHKYVVTTEKDAVKLASLWPAKSTELWYLSQAVRLTEGASLVAAALANLFQRATSIA
jgi:tetraacyldisaccharide 4'-kinase